jgi:hypothetical protein
MSFGLRRKFASHKGDAKRRGIPFLLTFDEWLGIWEASGRLPERGHGQGRYVMARCGDRGGYELGNVRVILFEENAREYRPTLDAKTRTGMAHRGKTVSVETREKLSEKAKARVHSLTARMKMSASQKLVRRPRNGKGQFEGMSSCPSD